MNHEQVEVAKIGKVVGLHGELKLHLLSDFEEQFKTGATFSLGKGSTIMIESYNPNRSLVKFEGYNVREDAAVLTNKKLYSTKEQSRDNCQLKEHQHFWFDLIDAPVYEGELLLGKIKEVERISMTDYLIVMTDEALVSKKLSKQFYIPYLIDVYIDHFDTTKKILFTKGAYDLLEAS